MFYWWNSICYLCFCFCSLTNGFNLILTRHKMINLSSIFPLNFYTLPERKEWKGKININSIWRRMPTAYWPSYDSEVRCHGTGAHKKIDVFMTYSAQFGYVTPESFSIWSLDQLAEQMNKHISVPTCSVKQTFKKNTNNFNHEWEIVHYSGSDNCVLFKDEKMLPR